MDVIDYPNYTIDRDGTVKNKKTGIVKSPFVNNSGYKRVNLAKDGKRHHYYVHRLLALHYIPNPENKRCVDHIDRNRLNNDLSNLRWATDSENRINSDRSLNRDLPNNIYKHGDNYQVEIRNKYYGAYATIEEAVIARDKAIRPH